MRAPHDQLRLAAAIWVVAVTSTGMISPLAITAEAEDITIVNEGDVATIKARLLNRELDARVSKDRIKKLLASIRADGSWADIDYADTNRTIWQPTFHMMRILSLARAYRASHSPLNNDPDVRQALLQAFDYWMAHDIQCPTNWWPNWVGIPRLLYRTMLLVEDELTPAQTRAGIEILKRARVEEQTGQNLVWVAETAIARGCLTDDDWLVMAGFGRIADEIRITSDEGIQADFSFHQHGEQFYSGGYGRAFSIDTPQFAEMARGTQFLSAAKTRILGSYLLDGQQWMVRGPTFDYSACGREITRKTQDDATLSEPLKHACRSMIKLDSPVQGFSRSPRSGRLGNCS